MMYTQREREREREGGKGFPAQIKITSTIVLIYSLFEIYVMTSCMCRIGYILSIRVVFYQTQKRIVLTCIKMLSSKYLVIFGLLFSFCCYNRVEGKLDFVKGLANLAEAVGNLIQVSDDCKYTCRNGKQHR